MLSFQDGQFDQVFSYMSAVISTDEHSSHTDQPDNEPRTTTGTTVM